MFNVHALMQALPTIRLEPEDFARIYGFSGVEKSWESITLLEPPAGKTEPFIEAIPAMEILYTYQGMGKDVAAQQAVNDFSIIRSSLDNSDIVVFFDSFSPDSPESIPARALIAFLRQNERISEHMASFLERAVEVTREAPVFEYEDARGKHYTLAQRPRLPHPKAMLDFVPGVPWGDIDGDDSDEKTFLAWRESMRPVVQSLENALGESPYYFCEWGDDLDDDNIHRFLLLHWCCTFRPNAPFLQYVLRASGAKSVDELKACLIDPANYTQPFKQYCVFFNAEGHSCRFEYLPEGSRHKTIGLVFATPPARDVAEFIIRQNIDADIFIAAPKDLLYSKSVKFDQKDGFLLTQAMQYNHCHEIRFLHEGVMNEPIAFLANIDELIVVANEKWSKDDRGLLLNESVEDLLWLALELQIPAQYYFVDRMRLCNPKSSMERSGVRQRVAMKKAARAAYTRQLPDLNIFPEWSSSGLWRIGGGMIQYDNLDVPLALIRRVVAWQKEYDGTLNIEKNDEWWEGFYEEGKEIAKEFHQVLAPATKVFFEDAPVCPDA